MKPAVLRCVLLGALVLGAGCDDLQAPAPSGSASIALSVSVAGGSAEAYDKTNRVFVRLVANDEVRFEQELPFTPAAETRVPLRVPMRNSSETFALNFELRRAGDPVFRGNSSLTLASDRVASVSLTLLPVVASVSCAGPVVQLSSYGETAQLQGVALFATGDTVRGSSLTWSTPSGGAVNVSSTGLVTAVRDGTAQVTCTAGQLTDTRQVQVAAVVRSILVAPPSASISIGANQTFTATMRDARGNVITGRTPVWATSNAAVATITQAGVALGVAAGTVRIDATNAGVTGSANLSVAAPIPLATTGPANVIRVTAVLQGTVNPNGASTQAYFEWGTSPTLTVLVSTGAQSVGSANGNVNVTETLSNLAPSTTYYFRIVATNSGGTARGQIQSFRTVDPGPPIVATNGGAFIGVPLVRFDGNVIPMGSSTRYYFLYGTRPDSLFYQTSAGSAGAGFDPVSVSDVIQWSGRLFVQLVAQNQYGVVYGNVVDLGFAPQVITAPVNRQAGTSAQVKGNQQE